MVTARWRKPIATNGDHDFMRVAYLLIGVVTLRRSSRSDRQRQSIRRDQTRPMALADDNGNYCHIWFVQGEMRCGH